MRIQRKRLIFISTFIAIILTAIFGISFLALKGNVAIFPWQYKTQSKIKLPAPIFTGKVSIEEALKQRRSIRQYKNAFLTLQEVAQLLWSAQGITSSVGFRTAPSAGGLYPLQIYLVSSNVMNLSANVYRYLPAEGVLELIVKGDKRNELAKAAFEQSSVKQGAINIVIAADYTNTIKKYGALGKRFVDMEAGHTAQNIYLQATALGLGTVTVGAFYEGTVKKLLNLPKNEVPLYIMPVGKI